MKRYFSIGMAGHIDHGKTTLTKALTGIDTDQLKEEKARGLSIEPGFAQLIKDDAMEVSLIDVPGHERFIRQMIAGVAGIDLVLLVIAADEGVMPQTIEHLQILSLLDIRDGLIVLTKVNEVDDELLELVSEDVQEHLEGTFLADAPLYYVDSLTKQGINQLHEAIINKLTTFEKRSLSMPFRLPIDHVFTVQGQGVIVRGTVYNGKVERGDELTLLPKNKRVRVRQMQSHQASYDLISAGQRAALNISGVNLQDVSRGDVLVANDYYSVTRRIDVSLEVLKNIKFPLRQRQTVKLFTNTAEVMGRIIYFDRNVIDGTEKEPVLCQIELATDVVVTRGDRFILRRPSPMETIGGGFIIHQQANKHRFGERTIEQLKLAQEQSPKERVADLLVQRKMLQLSEIISQAAITKEEFTVIKEDFIKISDQQYTSATVISNLTNHLLKILAAYHKQYTMRIGIDKAEVTSQLTATYPKELIEFVIKQSLHDGLIKVNGQYLSKLAFEPQLPEQAANHLKSVKKQLIREGIDVSKWSELTKKYNVSENLADEYFNYLVQTERAYIFDENRLISQQAVKEALAQLMLATKGESFTLQEARTALDLSRKNLIPLLELFDQLGHTKRQDNMRYWK